MKTLDPGPIKEVLAPFFADAFLAHGHGRDLIARQIVRDELSDQRRIEGAE